MAFTFNDEDVLKMEVSDGITISDKNSQSIESPLKAKDMTNEPMLTDSAEKDIFNSTDSLSSSTSFSDSDLTSTDSEDSLALSESESITDVTPLNSPYCDSPLPQSRIFDSKNEDKNSKIATRECPPEMNVLKQAIEKLELEAKEFDKQEGKVVSFKRRTKSQGHEDSKRMEQETRLFKRVVSRQNHRRTMSPTTNSPVKAHIVNRSQDNVKSDSEIKTSVTSRTMDEVSSAIKKK